MRILFYVFALLLFAGAALAFESPSKYSWIQIQALPSESDARRAAKARSAEYENLVGFQIGGGWYGLALGPFDRATADAEVNRLIGSGVIGRDSFVSNGTSYTSVFWPESGEYAGLNTLYVPVADRTIADNQPSAPQTLAVPTLPAQSAPLGGLTPSLPADPGVGQDTETVAEARASEQKMSRDAKKELQRALAWAGHYTAAIDGLYGRGTRAAMKAWQLEAGVEPTGIMTSAQREMALGAYNAVFSELGLTTIDHAKAGIIVAVPRTAVAEAKEEAPFLRYDAKDGSGISLILISQKGDEPRMRALYTVLQSIDAIPTEGPRKVTKSGFQIEGISDQLHTQGFASLKNGAIKGAILVWPAGDDARRTRVFERIKNSFERTDGVLPDAHFFDATVKPLDLASGLDLRDPRFVRTGSFVSAQGHVLTAAHRLETCTRLEQMDGTELTIAAQGQGAALLEPKTASRPMAHALFQTTAPKPPQQIIVGGYSYGGLLGAPTLTLGRMEDTKDLTGTDGIARLNVIPFEGDIGAPVMDTGGAMMGVLLPQPAIPNRTLPRNAQFAVSWPLIAQLLEQAGVTVKTTDMQANLHPEDLSLEVESFTTVVRCWD
ncbi:MAG: peptidoglycan-binding domain-containing protein [Planktomarina sp.]